MSRFVAVVLLLSHGLVFHLSHGVEVNVTDDKGVLCLYANLMLNFSVSYDVAENKTKTVSFELPDDVTLNESKCASESANLKLDFGDGHSWSVMFSLNGKKYQAGLVTFSYNLSDSKIFPEASSKGVVMATSKINIEDVAIDTCYSCISEELLQDKQVNMTLWNVRFQPFIQGGSRSENITSCPADKPTPKPTSKPTPTPTTTPTTTAPVTNSTTNATTTTTTTTPATTTPAPTLPTPSVGNYSVQESQNASACLLASFGLRIGFKQNEKFEEMNFDPFGARFSGSCGINSSELVLESGQINVTFSFLNESQKFFLSAVNVSVSASSGLFKDSNSTLSLWKASLGSSYMCNKEVNYTITDKLSLYTFNLHVQPFGVKKGLYSTAHECSLDDPSILIPIIVGAALAGLILVVVIAYVIGRRKTYAGYQTL